MSDPGLAAYRPAQRAVSHELVMQPALVDFAAFPSRTLHPSWRAMLFGDAIGDAVWSVPAAHRHLSRHIKRALNLVDIQTPDLSSPAWAIATLDGGAMERFTRHVGAVAMAADMRGVIDRRSIQVIVDQVGEALYAFALQRASLICPASVDIVGLLGVAVDFDAIGSQLQVAGRRITQCYLDQCDPALWARAQLKLTFVSEQQARGSVASMSNALATRIVLGVKREIA